jgi:hypothetical protein
MVENMTQTALEQILQLPVSQRAGVDLTQRLFVALDLRNRNLTQLDLRWSRFENCQLAGADLSDSQLANARFIQSNLRGAQLRRCNLQATDFRGCDIRETHIEGANLQHAALDHAQTAGMIADDQTQFFKMTCPATGPFIAYKKCFNETLVTLLIPREAKRVMGTVRAGRCNQARVLAITSFDGKEAFEETTAPYHPNFVYRLGATVTVPDFDDNRWLESAPGIYFCMTPAEAIAY